MEQTTDNVTPFYVLALPINDTNTPTLEDYALIVKSPDQLKFLNMANTTNNGDPDGEGDVNTDEFSVTIKQYTPSININDINNAKVLIDAFDADTLSMLTPEQYASIIPKSLQDTFYISRTKEGINHQLEDLIILEDKYITNVLSKFQSTLQRATSNLVVIDLQLLLIEYISRELLPDLAAKSTDVSFKQMQNIMNDALSQQKD